jgi:hypothetical protein
MALLGATSLVDCSKIPSFISQGSKMIFHMSTVPVSWTKDTTPNETMCRITNSSLSPGGSLTFSQTFQSSKQISGTAAQNNLGFNVNSTTVPVVATPANAMSTGSVSPVTVTVAQISVHNHGGNIATPSLSNSHTIPGTQNQSPPALTATQTNTIGSSGSHTHTVPSGPHSHSFSASHTHPIISSQHVHPITGSENFNILYVDVVIASKN